MATVAPKTGETREINRTAEAATKEMEVVAAVTKAEADTSQEVVVAMKEVVACPEVAAISRETATNNKIPAQAGVTEVTEEEAAEEWTEVEAWTEEAEEAINPETTTTRTAMKDLQTGAEAQHKTLLPLIEAAVEVDKVMRVDALRIWVDVEASSPNKLISDQRPQALQVAMHQWL